MAGSQKNRKSNPQKRRDEREKGIPSRSKDVVSVVLLFVAFFTLNLLVPFIYQQLKNFISPKSQNRNGRDPGRLGDQSVVSRGFDRFFVSAGATGGV